MLKRRHVAADLYSVHAPEVPVDEMKRLASLRGLNLLNSEPEERFDRITRLAKRAFGVPIALVSLVDADRQWFKSNVGLQAAETPRNMSFCGHAINRLGVMHVPDASLDPRFADNPLVRADPSIRFYAGCPIAAPDGSLVGTLCVIDSKARNLELDEIDTLHDLAAMVEKELWFSQIALDDELTGLRNRRGFSILATQALALSVRQRQPGLVIYADVNDLKPINDQYGHATGDRLLREVGQSLAMTFREADVIARLSGDEFAIFLSCYKTDAAIAEQRLNDHLTARNQAMYAEPYRLSLAIGTATSDPETPECLESLLARADRAMYTMKAQYHKRATAAA